MQQTKRVLQFEYTWYFVFGLPAKRSLIQQYALENEFLHLIDPPPEQLKSHKDQDLIIEAHPDTLLAIESFKIQIVTVFVGTEFTPEELAIKRDYLQLGRCISILHPNFPEFRRALYPTLLIIYGPDPVQNFLLSATYFNFIGYKFLDQPLPANTLISNYDKSLNYIVHGLVPDAKDLLLLEHYFTLRILHLQHDAAELPQHQQFFKDEAIMLPVLKTKPYFHSFDGRLSEAELTRIIGSWVCPEITYVHMPDEEQVRQFSQYLEATNGLLISINPIEKVLKRKPVSVIVDPLKKIQLITSIIYRDLSRTHIYLADFPWAPEEFAAFEARLRPFSRFLDLSKPESYSFSAGYSSQMLFLERQLRIHPLLDYPLKDQLKPPSSYWVVSGPACSGKTTVAKYISGNFGLKLLEYESYMAGMKEKLLAPGEEEVPLKSVIKHVQGLLAKERYVIDTAFFDAEQTDLWVAAIGAPNLINLKIEEKELIRRTRKKNQADVNAQITEEDTAKARDTLSKSNNWVSRVSEKCAASRVYQIDYSQPQLLAEKYIDSVLRPRILLVQSSNTLLYQNVALRHNLGFVNLHYHPLHTIESLIQTQSNSLVILCNFQPPVNQHLMCEDLYWIEKKLGPIVYLGVFHAEAPEKQLRLMELEKPPEPVSAKPEGDEPPAETEEGKTAKKGLDIYKYQWSEPEGQQNLSQWFFQLKKNAVKVQHSPKECFEGFGEVLHSIEDNHCVYETIHD